MKKILMLSVLFAVVIASCKKKVDDPSITVTASFPTITPVNLYFSIPLGGTLPAGTAIATAYDSFYQVSCPIVVIDTAVHTNVPGLYQAAATAKNKYGYLSLVTYYVAVTSLPNNNLNLAGIYQIDPTTAFENDITGAVTGYYSMNNFNGDSTGHGTAAMFALITDSTIAFTDANYGTSGVLSLATGDTTLSYTGGEGAVVYTKH